MKGFGRRGGDSLHETLLTATPSDLRIQSELYDERHRNVVSLEEKKRPIT